MQAIQIPSVGRVPAYALDPQNKAQLKSLVERCEALFRLSAKAWENANNFGAGRPEYYEQQMARSNDKASQGESLLIPLGIKCNWPGLYPSFTVKGFSEHSTESAVCVACGHERNFLRV